MVGYSSAQQAQNNAAAAAVHAAIHLKEIPEESLRQDHDAFASNHNYNGSNGPSPSPAPGPTPNGPQAPPQNSEYEFAGY